MRIIFPAILVSQKKISANKIILESFYKRGFKLKKLHFIDRQSSVGIGNLLLIEMLKQKLRIIKK